MWSKICMVSYGTPTPTKFKPTNSILNGRQGDNSGTVLETTTDPSKFIYMHHFWHFAHDRGGTWRS